MPYRVLALIISLGLLLSSTGCNTYKIFPESVDVEKLMFARVLAIDSVTPDPVGRSEDDQAPSAQSSLLRITIGSRMTSTSATESERKMEFFASEGRTFFEAVRNFSNRVDKEVFLGHLDYIVLGRDIIKLDPELFLDPLLRDQSIRSSTCMIACPDITAEEFLLKSSTGDAFPAERLDNMFLGERLLSESSHTESIDSQHFFTLNNRIKTIDFLRDLNSLSQTAMMPCISQQSPDAASTTPAPTAPAPQAAPEENTISEENTVQEVQEKEKEESDDQLFALSGYAIYRDHLIGYLNGTQGRAANMLLGRLYSGQLFLQTPEGYNVSMELLGCKRQFIPQWEGDVLTVDINITVQTAIAEIQGSTSSTSPEFLNRLIHQQNSVITQEIEELIHYTQENKCDIIGIAQIFARKYPVRFQKNIGTSWADDVYPQVVFRVHINSVVEHSGNLQAPIMDG